nr:uncharacterized protein LOC105867292 isoform X2 [Microcebus murinus]XP_012612704.1 uncharacterized protein LOC105867292 isoform X2 [Microcebus murinus]
MQVNLEKVAGRAGRPSAAGRRRPGPARFRFRLGQRSLTALVADAVTGSRGPLFTAGRRSNTVKPEPEGEPQRASGPRKWALGRALRRCPPGAVPPRQELREPVPLCSPPLRRGKQGSVWNPGLRATAAGLCSAAALAQRRPRSGAVPGRARLLTCAPQVRIEFKATPEDEHAASVPECRPESRARRGLWRTLQDFEAQGAGRGGAHSRQQQPRRSPPLFSDTSPVETGSLGDRVCPQGHSSVLLAPADQQRHVPEGRGTAEQSPGRAQQPQEGTAASRDSLPCRLPGAGAWSPTAGPSKGRAPPGRFSM